MQSSWSHWLLWIVIAVMLLSQLYISRQLWTARQDLILFLETTSGSLNQLGGEDLPYVAEINREIPFEAAAEINDTFAIPVQTTVPINTVVTVPINVPLVGTTNISVPIRTSVPVNFTATVPINKKISVRGVTAVKLDTPIRLEESAIGDILKKLAASLAELQSKLQN